MSDPNEPNKYTDSRRAEVTQEWLDWDEDRREEVRDQAYRESASTGYDPSTFFPDETQAIPAEGAWILVLEEPSTPLKEKFRVPPLSMWRARRHFVDGSTFTSSAGDRYEAQQAVISTPAGDLHFWPYEYRIATAPMELASMDGVELHSLGGEPVVDEEELFYIQSRGIRRQDALLMLFDKIASLDFVYVTFPEEVTSALEGVGRSLRRHIALSPRNQQHEEGLTP